MSNYKKNKTDWQLNYVHVSPNTFNDRYHQQPPEIISAVVNKCAYCKTPIYNKTEFMAHLDKYHPIKFTDSDGTEKVIKTVSVHLPDLQVEV